MGLKHFFYYWKKGLSHLIKKGYQYKPVKAPLHYISEADIVISKQYQLDVCVREKVPNISLVLSSVPSVLTFCFQELQLWFMLHVQLLTRQKLQTVREYNWNLIKAPMLIGNLITLHKHFSTQQKHFRLHDWTCW